MRIRVATRRHETGPARRILLRFVFSLGIAGLFFALLRQRIGQIDTALVASELATIAPLAWLAALGATVTSFWAIGQYDVTIHRHLATGVPAAVARRAGMAAIAVSQTLGAGLVTGALVRWRCLGGINLWQATLLSGAVAVSFLGGWAVVTSLVVLAHGPASLAGVAGLILSAFVLLAVLATLQPRALHRLHLPNLLTLSRLFMWTCIDTAFAALALWLLLPGDLAFSAVLPAFLLAYGAGLVSGTPAGVGAFEVTFLALLPQLAEAPMLAGILGWRLVYFAIPAVLGSAVAAIGIRPAAQVAAPPTSRTSSLYRTESAIAAAPRAEYALARQGRLSVVDTADTSWLVGRTPHMLAALLDPTGPVDLGPFAARAHAEARFPAIYKAGPRTALLARAQGWHVAALGAEAWVSPTSFHLDGPARATLRRKLRKSQAAGVQIALLPAQGSAELAASVRQWQPTRRERGFSMGQFDACYIATQRVYVARLAGRIVAFVTLHQGPYEWTVDLMRLSPAAPDGTMHYLIVQAIGDARGAAVPRFSLAAAGAPRALPHLLRLHADAAAFGLVRFKQSFAPHWTPHYLCAPSRSALAVAAVEIAMAIHWPAPLHPQDHHAQYGFAPVPRAWQRMATVNT